MNHRGLLMETNYLYLVLTSNNINLSRLNNNNEAIMIKFDVYTHIIYKLKNLILSLIILSIYICP